MSEQSEGKLKQLERLLPEGLLVASAWLGPAIPVVCAGERDPECCRLLSAS